MSNELKDYISNWLIKAEHDLLNAETVIEYNPIILDTACFHCQQAVEKYLKAFLIFKNVAIQRTHNLAFIIEECGKLDASFLNIDLKNLNDFGVEIRYPDNFSMPTIQETKEYFQIAKSVQALALSKIKL